MAAGTFDVLDILIFQTGIAPFKIVERKQFTYLSWNARGIHERRRVEEAKPRWYMKRVTGYY